MDERGLRDIERWRDKIEVRLDNRQVFFLFFGSALVACLLFVLGVIVGKRLESRGRAVAPETEDPLALLDKVSATPRVAQTAAVTFPQTLFGKNGTTGKKGEGKVDVKPAEAVKLDTPKPDTAKIAEPAKAANLPAGEGNKTAAKMEETAAVDTARPADKNKTDGKQLAKVDVKPTEPKLAPKAADPKPAPIPVISASATDSSKGKARFTLQLSSFQTREEAETFAKKFDPEKTYLVVSEIPGKGTWYRVRLGDFANAKDALAGKLAFERRHGVIAYVAQR
jgi:septal ring-binding cell division protein DamX